MELIAAIKALETLSRESKIEVFTDSQYLKNGITDWIDNWKIKGRLLPGPKQVKNADLWIKLDKSRERHDVTWSWVKGHAGNAGNTRADKLARDGMGRFLK